MSKHIFWIASYPKSGNTLLRLILHSLFFTRDGKGSINQLNSIPFFEKTRRLNIIKKINPKDFESLNEIDVVYNYLELLQSKKNLDCKGDFIFLKTHSALISYNNKSFTNDKNSLGYIYILRDPRDVVISWAKHTNITIDESLSFIKKETAFLNWHYSNKSLLPKDLEVKTLMLDWSTHVRSWVEQGMNVPKLILRYEDLVYNKKYTIKKIVNFFTEKFGFKFSNIDEKIENIIQLTNFNKLQQAEINGGFGEATNGLFFREGKKNQWKKKLKDNQIKNIEDTFKDLMKKYEYELNYN